MAQFYPRPLELPVFEVAATAGPTMPGIVTGPWGTPTINRGFAAWSGGVLTVAQPGLYLCTGTIGGNATQRDYRIYAGSQFANSFSEWQSGSLVIGPRWLAAGDTIFLQSYGAAGTGTSAALRVAMLR